MMAHTLVRPTLEHIIRNEDELNRIRQYIRDNPMNGGTDEENLNRRAR
ncbi:MAG TPA: hypothetical protein VGB26_03740 [Nitrospiria bacterium]|jgi:hypothetical protein